MRKQCQQNCVQRKKFNICTHTYLVRAQKIYRQLQEILSVPWERVELKDTGNFQLLPFCGENKTSMCYVWSNIKEKETQPVFCYLKEYCYLQNHTNADTII